MTSPTSPKKKKKRKEKHEEEAADKKKSKAKKVRSEGFHAYVLKYIIIFILQWPIFW